MQTCCIHGCNKPRYQRHFECASHYMRKYRYGHSLASRQRGPTKRVQLYWAQWLVSELRATL